MKLLWPVEAAASGVRSIWSRRPEGLQKPLHLQALNPLNLHPLQRFRDGARAQAPMDPTVGLEVLQRLRRVRLERDVVRRWRRVLHIARRHRMFEDALLLIGLDALELFAATAAEELEATPSGGNGSASKGSAPRSGLPGRLRRGEDDTGSTSDLENADDDMVSEAGDSSFCIGVAYAQIEEVECDGVDVTVTFLPSTRQDLPSSRQNPNSASVISFALPSPEEAQEVAAEIKAHMAMYLRAMVWLDKGYPLVETMRPTLVALVSASAAQIGGTSTDGVSDVGRLLCVHPQWGEAVTLPHSWSAACENSKASSELLRVYLATSLGPGWADVSPAILTRYHKGTTDQSSFFVRVTLQEAASPEEGPGHLTVPDTASADKQPTSTQKLAALPGGSSLGVQLHLTVSQFSLAALTNEHASQPELAPLARPPSTQQPVATNRTVFMLAMVAIVLFYAVRAILQAFGKSWGWQQGEQLYMQYILLAGMLLCGGHMLLMNRRAKPRQLQPPASDTQPVSSPAWQWSITIQGACIVTEPCPEHGGSFVEGAANAKRSAAEAPLARPSSQPQRKVSEDVWHRYVEGCGETVASTRLQMTLAWRETEKIDTILQRPHRQFGAVKQLYQHALVGMSKTGNVVFLERLGQVRKNWSAYLKTGFTEEDALRHQAFIMEYMWGRVDPRPSPHGRMLRVIDMKGVGMGDIGGTAFNYIKKAAMITGAHYPQRLYKAYIINAPAVFKLVWRMAQPFMTELTISKIRILGSVQDVYKAFLEELDDADILQDWGGSCRTPLYELPMEAELAAFAAELNAQR